MYLYIHEYCYYIYLCHLATSDDTGFVATCTFDLIPHLPGFADEALNALREILQQRVDEFLKFVDPATALAPEAGWDTGTGDVGSKSWWIFIQTVTSWTETQTVNKTVVRGDGNYW